LSDTTLPAQPARKTALERLDELKRAYQRMLRRRPTMVEKALMDRAALMTVRAEMAAGNPKADSNTIVRLDNAARRSRNDFERVCGIEHARKPRLRSMADIEAELAGHV
jgi:hypothetical protein